MPGSADPDILPLSAARDRSSVGGKALGLADAIRFGLRVPPAVVVPIDLAGLAVEQPQELGKRLGAATASLGSSFAVRSSGLEEDSAEASHAGQYPTMLAVAPDDLLPAVLECAAHGVAVIVQQMVDAVVAGVAFSVDPVTGRHGVVIEATGGLADHLLEGTEDGERWVEGVETVPETRVLTDAQAGQVVGLVQELEAAVGSPVDVEWAFDDRQLWLIQVRPLTVFAHRRAVDLPDRQTWTQAPRFPDPMHRLSFSNWFPIHTAAFDQVFADFGLPAKTVEHRRVEGKVYSRDVPFRGASRDDVRLPAWAFALAMRLPPLRSHLAKAKRYDGEARILDLIEGWESTAAPAAMARTRQIRQADLSKLDDVDLSNHIDRVRDHIQELAVVHFRLTLGAVMIPTGRLGLFVQEHLGWGPLKTIDLVGGFGDANSHAGLVLAEIAASLSEAEEAVIRADRAAVMGVDGIDQFLDEHGHRLNIDLTKPTLAEDLGRLVHLVLAAGSKAEDPRLRAGEREAEARSALDPSHRAEFGALLRLARRGRPCQDASELAVFDAVALMRPVAIEAGSRLAASGRLPLATDVWHLDVTELQQMLTAEITTVPDLVERRSEMAWAATHAGARRYGPEPMPPPDIEALPRGLRNTLGAILWSAALETPPPVDKAVDGALVGLPGAPGRAEGAVRFVNGEADFVDVGPGDIVVCRTAVAAWSPIFAVAGGIVTESGGALSHPATLAREYGLPAVMSVHEAMTRLTESEWVRIDGGEGTVTIL
ncbi:MAG: PEP/pyruvate-binding domain-containing protein [Acidimicrobiia bacterium]|nr:PEP/pyruvate-binding domain-containing protein [Acidimicrobiia bacterium]